MRIAVDHLFQRIRRPLVAIEHGIADEEALVAAEAVDHRIRHAGGGCLHRVVGHGQTTEVGDVLAQGQVAVDLERSEEHKSELQSLMRTSYAALCLKKKK